MATFSRNPLSTPLPRPRRIRFSANTMLISCCLSYRASVSEGGSPGRYVHRRHKVAFASKTSSREGVTHVRVSKLGKINVTSGTRITCGFRGITPEIPVGSHSLNVPRFCGAVNLFRCLLLMNERLPLARHRKAVFRCEATA